MKQRLPGQIKADAPSPSMVNGNSVKAAEAGPDLEEGLRGLGPGLVLEVDRNLTASGPAKRRRGQVLPFGASFWETMTEK